MAAGGSAEKQPDLAQPVARGACTGSGPREWTQAAAMGCIQVVPVAAGQAEI